MNETNCEERLKGIEVYCYGVRKSGLEIFQEMTDNELEMTFGGVLEEFLQTKRIAMPSRSR